MTLKHVASATTITISTPEFGYDVNVQLSTYIERQSDNSYKIWDDLVANDFRTLTATWVLDSTDTNSLLELFRDKAQGRGENLELVPDLGFFPAGPDKGDAGTFNVRMLTLNQRPVEMQPVLHFINEITFSFNGSFPSYTIPAQVTEGGLTIGTISGLRFPQNGNNVNIGYAVNTQLAQDGTPYTIDISSIADFFETTFPMILQETNMAKLVEHLQTTVRGGTLNITPPANSFIFGRTGGGTATYLCTFIQSTIGLTHVTHDRWIGDFSFYRDDS